MKRIIILLHRYLGLAAALFAIVLGCSGSLLVFRQELQPTIPAQTLPAQSSPANYQAGYDTIRALHPRGEVTLRLADSRQDAIEARIRMPGHEDNTLWLDPVSGKILPVANSTTDGWRWLHSLHERLLLSEGKTWVGGVGVVILLVLLSGIIHWWPKNWAKAWRVRSDKGLAILIGDLHRCAGAAMLLLLLLSTLSGLVLAFNQPIRNWLTPAGHGKAGKQRLIKADVPRLPLDRLVSVAQRQLPQGRLTSISISAQPAKPVTLRLRLPGELHPNGSTLLSLDPYHATVLKLEKTEETTPWRRISSWALVLHDGSIGGLTQRILMCASGLLLMLLGISGVYQWLARRNKRLGLAKAAST
ncbi:PepSY domain-containing protein [Aquitalea palustris]|uniref:PepSY domain-containing protein n=1 Tax=Aquitalea palustris TaxID=2480983 RepID=A0A454JHR3_9NEIS|nr:PepSY-associated TM helix domain-containing protein [Aquitalea palustris]RMC96850.1 PepSY domain-containing protein [Aquitalea palustris]